MGRLLTLPKNIRLPKKLPRTKHSSLFCRIVRDDEKKFYNIDERSLQKCLVCPKIIELNAFVRTATQKSLASLDPYSCIECGKQYSWDECQDFQDNSEVESSEQGRVL
jgi:hypothetical protein